ncbi:MAG: tRNA pseudouridine(55) synthase TruB [Flavobacteriales bacterium]|nr:tRNA pseudouridine(55) synthase TruB [Flavobacteriales bacterium]
MFINNLDQASKILLIDKPKDWTSFDVVKKIRGLVKKKYNIKKIKVGHSGTLDPLATGLLVVCVGNKTKDIRNLELLEKEYVGTIKLGCITDSFDSETPEKERKTYSHLSEKDIADVLCKFHGSIQQLPPIFSAIKVKGERLYKKARRGDKNIELKKRSITILDLKLESVNLPLVKFKVKCSKGTYIRSLAHDIGQKLNCGAYLYELRRVGVGQYKIKDAQSINDIFASL